MKKDDAPLKKKKQKSDSYLKIGQIIKAVAPLDHSISVPSWGTLFKFEPHEPIGRAQVDIANIFGSAFAYPSTNGTTPLNVMALLCLAYPEDAVMIQRDSHVSVLAPIIHAGLKPVYITPSFSRKLGVTMGVTPEELERNLNENPDTKIIFLTYPNYFGIATDIARLAAIAQKRNIPLIVDSAHGSHWVFHSSFPMRAEIAGATIVTYSTHKTSPALGQGSIMLVNNLNVVSRLYEVVNNLGFVSTSFSSVILTSLFHAISTLEQDGEEVLGERIKMAEWARKEINATGILSSFGIEEAQPGFINFDPLRLTVDVSRTGLTGYEVETIMYKKYKCYPEMGTLQNVLFLVTPGINWEDIRRLVHALKEIACIRRRKRNLASLTAPTLPRQIVMPREAFYSRKRRQVSISDAIGRISAETISAYPPGSAVIVAGEELTAETLNFLRSVQKFGGTLKGATDPSFRKITILDI